MFFCNSVNITQLSESILCVYAHGSEVSMVLFAPLCTQFFKLDMNDVSGSLVDEKQPPGATHPWYL